MINFNIIYVYMTLCFMWSHYKNRKITIVRSYIGIIIKIYSIVSPADVVIPVWKTNTTIIITLRSMLFIWNKIKVILLIIRYCNSITLMYRKEHCSTIRMSWFITSEETLSVYMYIWILTMWSPSIKQVSSPNKTIFCSSIW